MWQWIKLLVFLGFSVAILTGCGQESPPAEAEQPIEEEDSTTEEATTVIDPSTIAETTQKLDGERIINADSEPGNWLSHGRTYDEQRFSPLDQITTENIGELELAWYQDTGSKRGLEATPIVVDGVMYTTGAWSTVQAYDAKTGERIWEYDPMVPKSWGKYACCDVVNRGAAVWKGRVYVGTIDGRLVALDAVTGEVDWDVLTIDKERPYTITGAPRVLKDLIIIGNGGAELGVRGYITAYDTETGEQKWRFYTVPGDPNEPFESPAVEAAAKTWLGGKWWEVGGGGTVWDSMAYDPELNLLYIGVGNGSPWNRYIRSPGGGDNLYLSSIVAINPDDGSLVWYYQTTPGDNWDYTATQHIILADIEINGEVRKTAIQAPKNGFFYVIDRTDGSFISAEAYVPVNWASHIDPETGRPVETDDANYSAEAKTVFPGPLGGHNWHPMTYSPMTGLVYIPALDLSFTYAQDNAFKHEPGQWNLGVRFDPAEPAAPATPEEQMEILKSVQGRLLAWDPVSQKEQWRIEHTSAWNGGLLSTAGNLVFQGRSDGMFAAYTADSGELVWEREVHTGIIAAPVSYEIDGEQYIAVVAGWGGAFGTAAGVPRHKGNVLQEGRVLAFKLKGKAEMPAPAITYVNMVQPPEEITTTPERLFNGQQKYQLYCGTCHGSNVTSGSQIPDLKYLNEAGYARFESVVPQGVLEGLGMPKFDHVLSDDDVADVKAFVAEATRLAIAFCDTTYPEDFPEFFGTSCTKREVDNSAVAEPGTDE